MLRQRRSPDAPCECVLGVGGLNAFPTNKTFCHTEACVHALPLCSEGSGGPAPAGRPWESPEVVVTSSQNKGAARGPCGRQPELGNNATTCWAVGSQASLRQI